MNNSRLRRGAVLLLAAMTMCSSQTLAADPTLCDFVTKVAAVGKTGFAPYKGKQEDVSFLKDGMAYTGLLAPPDGKNCNILIWKASGGEPNYYSCSLGPDYFLTFAQADTLYDRTIATLRTCFPKASFKETKQGEVNSNSESFTWDTHVTLPGYSLSVTMDNAKGMSRAFSQHVPITPKTPMVNLELYVNDE